MKRVISKLFAYIILCLVFFPTQANEIKHIFLATDESRQQLLYVDQFSPENNWTVNTGKNRDLQIIDSNRVILSSPKGYREYDIKTGKLIKEIQLANNIASIIRLANGHTFLANKKNIWHLDENDKVIKKLDVSLGKFFRLLRLTKQGNFLFTSSKTTVSEMDTNGKIIQTIDLKSISKGTLKPYFCLEMANGNYLMSTGYGANLLEITKQGELIRTIGKNDSDSKDIKFNFFADSNILDNGNIVVANWTGHKKTDSYKAPQILEFDIDGKLVWQWHDPVNAGSIHGIAVIK